MKRLPSTPWSNTRNILFKPGYTTGFARDYLATYYIQPPTNDERLVMEFLVRHAPKIAGAEAFLEIGCGPTVHHAIPFAKYAQEIHMADYMKENLNVVQQWKDSKPSAHNWDGYIELTLALEKAADETAQQRKEIVRKKITKLLMCDLRQDHPFYEDLLYPAVGCFYCAEVVGTSFEQWLQVMARISVLVEPGGWLLLSALGETESYKVVGPAGQYMSYPCARLRTEDFYEVLPFLGFDLSKTVIDSSKVTGQEREGITDVILVAAKKTGIH